MSIKHEKLYNWVQHNSSFYSVQLYDVKDIILEQKKIDDGNVRILCLSVLIYLYAIIIYICIHDINVDVVRIHWEKTIVSFIIMVICIQVIPTYFMSNHSYLLSNNLCVSCLINIVCELTAAQLLCATHKLSQSFLVHEREIFIKTRCE